MKLHECYSKGKNLQVLNEEQAIINHLLTQLRDKNTGAAQYRHYSGRIMTLLIEEAISKEIKVVKNGGVSPTGASYDSYDLKHAPEKFCGISILRAGDSMLGPLMDAMPEIAVGKILIQRDEKTAEPVFYYCKLPADMAKMERVFLVDPMLATGGSASMAIKKIVEQGVSPDKITFINLVACPDGVDRIQKDYPDVQILTACIDPILNNKKYIIPGLGDYGDRYFASTRPL